MAKSVLVVEGNTRSTSKVIASLGGVPYGIAYAGLLEELAPGLETMVVHPVERGANCLPEGKSLGDYDGIVITGSALSCYEGGTAVSHQRELAKLAFESGTPVFGSCWGMQIMTEALGGRVRKNPSGREIGIGKDITLNEAGRTHPMFADRPDVFDVLEVHLDEVEMLPEGAELLAGNAMSAVQAMAIERGGCSFWGVQYHPEFGFETMAIVLQRLTAVLIREELYASPEDVGHEAETFERLHREGAPYLTEHIADGRLRRLEIINWLNARVL